MVDLVNNEILFISTTFCHYANIFRQLRHVAEFRHVLCFEPIRGAIVPLPANPTEVRWYTVMRDYETAVFFVSA